MLKPQPKNQEPVCPLCHHKKYNVLFTALDADRLQTKTFEIARCITCSLVSTRPFLDDNAVGEWYRAKYHGWWQGKRQFAFSVIINLFQKHRSEWIKRYVVKGDRLIDVGYGDGTFINYMSNQGFETYGVENPNFLPQTKFNAVFGDILMEIDDDKSGKKMLNADVITFWHVLEHVTDPLSTLQQAFEVLNPTGLLIISSPNFNSVQSALFRDKWFHLDVPRHRWHFSPPTMTEILQKSGFAVVHLSHFSLEYNPIGWFQSLLNFCHCSHNFAYNLFKRGELPTYNGTFRRKLYDILSTVLMSFVFLPAACILSLLESYLHRGGTITIAARKVEKSGKMDDI